MKAFTHVNAHTVEEVCGLLHEFGGRARINAGGTDLLGVLKDRIHAEPPEVIINVKTVPDLADIGQDDGLIRIGALATLSTIGRSALLKDTCAILPRAAQAVGTPQIRNQGTLGGNLCQETRCWYYRYPRHLGGPIGCLRKGNGPCLAVKGDNRYHAIMGGRGCFAVCPSDMAVALTAVGAKIVIAGPDASRREIAVGDLYTPLGTTLERGEFVTEVKVPPPAPPAAAAKQSFLKFTVREPVDFAVVSVASSITVLDGVCTDARIVLGAVGPGPHRATEAEELLCGKRLDVEIAEKAGAAALAGAKPLRKNGYKVEIAKTLVKRAVMECAQV